MPFLSSTMPFFPAPYHFSESTFFFLHFGKKICQNLAKIKKVTFFIEDFRNKFGKIYDHDSHSRWLFIVTQ